jgi:hypothetical protein
MLRKFTLVLLVAVAASSCTGSPTASPQAIAPTQDPQEKPAPPAPDPSPSALPSPADVAGDVAYAIRRREELGLRHDLAWVRAVAEDPAAIDAWGFPVLPVEHQALMNRGLDFSSPVMIVNDYARDHRDEFGGLYPTTGTSNWSRSGRMIRTSTLRHSEISSVHPSRWTPARFGGPCVSWTA